MDATGMRVQPLDGGSPATAHRDVGAVNGGATHASRRFAAVAPSVSETRRFLLSLLPGGCESADAAEAADAAALMLSELATNAVQHAGTDFDVTVDIAPDGRHLRVAVSDGAESFPVPQDTDTEASDGRGLRIVGDLADAWGIDVRRGRLGKTVWFCLLLPATGAARACDRERRNSHELPHTRLPDAIPPVQGGDVAAGSLPAAGVEVGGDWCDVVPITDSLVALVVGDVQGRDPGAAKIMRQHRHTLELLLREEQSPGQALERLNPFCLLGSEPRLATALVGVLDRSTGTITFSSAGHPPPLQVDGDRAHELLVPPGPPLGVQRCRYKDHTFKLADGCLVMFTDGLVERRASFLEERFGKLEMSRRAAAPSSEPGLVADFVIEAMTSDERSSDAIVVLTARRDAGGA
jgi:anti-sigma regulatory factor (Ser/Thr protein kinase)